MADKETKRLTPRRLANNDTSFAALKIISDYKPANDAYTMDKGTTIAAAMKNARDTEDQAAAALKTARDNAVAAEWAMHNYILGAKDQIVAQFGKSSNEYQSLGMKKKTEYKKPAKKAAKKEAKKEA